MQAQLREIQALEQREAALQKELDLLTEHGYDMVAMQIYENMQNLGTSVQLVLHTALESQRNL